jgi:tRNA U34 5-methylaminomethyl-2-thiouridine-forming methyltransferase MnmC
MSFVIYARGHRPPDQYPRDHIVVFPEAPQAKAWLQRMEQNLPPGFTLRSEQMDAIRAAPDTDWQLDDQHDLWIRRFKYGTWDEVHVKDEPEVADAKEAQRSPRPERSARAQRPDGYVTITELCATSAVPACDARAALRASGRDKPAYGWAFDPKEVPAIKKLVGIR